MTNRAAISWLILAAIFASCAFVVNRLSSRAVNGPTASVRLLDAPLDEISSLFIRAPAQAAITFTSRPGTGTWLATQDGGVPWPVEPGRISALLRVLAGTVGTPISDQTVSDAATSIELRSVSHSPGPTMRVDTQSLGGRTLIEVAEGDARRTLLIDDALRRALSGAGPMSWRDRRAFPDLPSDPTRIILRMPAHTIELARIGNRWGLRSPIAARADADAVGTVIRALQSMDATRFIDTLPADGPAFPEQSQVAITIESASFEPGTAVRTVDRWTLDLGGVSPQGGAFVARVARAPADAHATARPAYGPILIELGSDRLATIPAVIEAYLPRVLLDIPSSDIGSLTLAPPVSEGLRYQRTASGWSLATDASTPASPIPDMDRRHVDAIVTILADARAERTTLLDSEASLPGGMTLTIFGLSGQPLETCSLFLDEIGSRPQLIIRVGQVVRAYFITPELAAWINAGARSQP